MNNDVMTIEKRNLPLWLVVLLVSTLIVVLSSLGLSAYKKIQLELPSPTQQAELDSLKQKLLQQSDVIDTNWLHTLNPLIKDVEGRLLWSTALQKGMVSFNNLPKINKNQRFHLIVYDLDDPSNKPVSALTIKQDYTGRFEQSFEPEKRINSPLKFELVLEEKGSDSSLPLLLAQP